MKVKRFFFFFFFFFVFFFFFFLADRHDHAWLKKIEHSRIDLGKGKRMLVRGGKLDATYQLTVPEDLDGVQ